MLRRRGCAAPRPPEGKAGNGCSSWRLREATPPFHLHSPVQTTGHPEPSLPTAPARHAAARPQGHPLTGNAAHGVHSAAQLPAEPAGQDPHQDQRSAKARWGPRGGRRSPSGRMQLVLRDSEPAGGPTLTGWPAPSSHGTSATHRKRPENGDRTPGVPRVSASGKGLKREGGS